MASISVVSAIHVYKSFCSPLLKCARGITVNKVDRNGVEGAESRGSPATRRHAACIIQLLQARPHQGRQQRQLTGKRDDATACKIS